MNHTVDLAIFNLQGQRVATLVQGMLSVGPHLVRWTGNDDQGHPLASGLYFSRLQTGTAVKTRKLLLVR